ncbi:MAG: IPT/TIG domain-containing protein [Myxococcales bacterium]|nr:IPT/TIG domain-containing protein [Myxococcales bacterium]
MTLASALLFGAIACSGGGEVQIANLEPRVAGLQGDQAVKITGRNFRTDIGYTVYFGNQRAKAVAILDPTTIVAYTPTTTDPQTVDITIRMDDGNAFRIKNAFRFEDQGVNVMEGLGEGAQKTKKGNLAY